MMTGQQALWRIEQATAAARAEEERCRAELAEADAELARLSTARGALLRELAGARLEALRREGVVPDYASAEARALKLLDGEKAALDALRGKIAAAEGARAAAEAERRAQAQAAEATLAALEERQAGVEAQTRGSASWLAAREALDEAQRTLDAAERKAASSEADRAAKGAPYEADPLFMYLLRRDFGGRDYRAGGLTRYFDGLVARLVGYQDARANYRMLNEIPVLLREHAARRRTALEAAREKLAAVEAEGLEAAGLKPLIEEARAAREKLFATDARLKAADATLTQLDAEQDRALAARQRQVEDEAIGLVAQADAGAAVAELYRKAAATMSDRDDALVRQIEAGDRTLAAAQRKRVDLLSRARGLAQRRHEIEAERARFHRAGYDNPRGGFSNEGAIADALAGFLKGAVTGAVLGQVLQQGYSERGRRAGGGWLDAPSDAGSSQGPWGGRSGGGA